MEVSHAPGRQTGRTGRARWFRQSERTRARRQSSDCGGFREQSVAGARTRRSGGRHDYALPTRGPGSSPRRSHRVGDRSRTTPLRARRLQTQVSEPGNRRTYIGVDTAGLPRGGAVKFQRFRAPDQTQELAGAAVPGWLGAAASRCVADRGGRGSRAALGVGCQWFRSGKFDATLRQ